MYKPSSILTMVCPNGETHVEREERYAEEQRRRLMKFMISPVVKEITERIGRELWAEYERQQAQRLDAKIANAREVLTDLWYNFSATDDPTLRKIVDAADAARSDLSVSGEND